MGAPKIPMRTRILRNIVVDTSGCWLWTGYVTGQGYGESKVDGRKVGSHRVSYEAFVGPIPDGLTIDHLCRVRHCVNPEHLEPVTIAENTRRGVGLERSIAHNLARTRCKQGHPFTSANTYIDPRGWRSCRTCRRSAAARYTANRRAS